jgi:hypothetical protein
MDPWPLGLHPLGHARQTGPVTSSVSPRLHLLREGVVEVACGGSILEGSNIPER